jgi:hypothetical protein
LRKLNANDIDWELVVACFDEDDPVCGRPRTFIEYSTRSHEMFSAVVVVVVFMV